MASEVKTNKISPSTSTTVTLGDASDVFQLPASAEIDIASGATLDVNGTIDLTGATKTGFPGGLDNASQWRLTADFTGDIDPLKANVVEVSSPVGFGKLGSGMSLDASTGYWTFPATGYWQITFTHMSNPSTVQGSTISIFTTTDNSTYVEASRAYINGYYYMSGGHASYLMDVTDTTTHKCYFKILWEASAASQTTLGDTNFNETSMTFIKLGDT
tara:strand:- start:332 stop:979 length:648 start_codon:yes stop_codon:yes gene_type:complete